MSIVFLLLSLGYLILGVIFYLRPIKKRNPILGFRTISSMSSKAAWDKANKTLFKYMAIIGICSLLVSLFILIGGTLGAINSPDMVSFVMVIVQSFLMLLMVVFINRRIQKHRDME